MAQALRLDPIKCKGYGICAGVLPERISLDDWGYPLIDSSAVPEQVAGRVRRAVDACPVLALSLRPIEGPMATRASGRSRGELRR
jgi:ferredoxin